MLKTLLVILFALFFCAVHAQYIVKFILKEKTAIHHDSIYITGTMSNWDSTSNLKYRMKSEGSNEKIIVLNVPGGPLRYKFHRGSWPTVEKEYNGNEVPDHRIIVTKDTTVTDSISAWRDELLIDKKYSLTQSVDDTSKVFILASIASGYAFYPEWYNSDSALMYAQQALQVQQKIAKSDMYKSHDQEKDMQTLINLQETIAGLMHELGNYGKALQIRLENISLAEKAENKLILVDAFLSAANDYSAMKDYRNSLNSGKSMDSVLNTLDTNEVHYKNSEWYRNEKIYASYTVANAYHKLQLSDSALHYAFKMPSSGSGMTLFGFMILKDILLGDIYTQKKYIDSAFAHYTAAIQPAISVFAFKPLADIHTGMAKLFQLEHRTDSALFYANLAFVYFQNNKLEVQSWGQNSDNYLADISPLLAELYNENHQPDSAYKYLRYSVMLKDSLYNSDKIRQFQTLSFNEVTRRNQLEQQEKESHQQYKTRIKIYGLIVGMLAFFIVAFVLYRSNEHKQSANILLQSQKQEIETTLVELKNTQKQLIQSEKMASLGELTAGIAHEIQNPLNFVNNFSEVNKELLHEMQDEMNKGNISDANAIANDVIENSEKISNHGKRADAIVKGMLQHSRKNEGIKEPADINGMCDEYLKLSYHGLRAKDKNFNVTMKTDFDNSINKINIIPQDISRVLLNLFNNAFYATIEKQKAKSLTHEDYKPTVSIQTKKINDLIEIKVVDNGNGVPSTIINKIFQPFFTTKPTGQGTGLGLSLSYDIIKAHSGELNVETKEGEGTTFIIKLPV